MKNENNQLPKPSFLSPILPQGEKNLNILSFGAKANEIKTNQTKNIVINKTIFNARTDSVNYYNNKLNLKNSKFLNKNTNLTKDNLELNNLTLINKNLLLTLASKYLNLNKESKDIIVNNQINNFTSLINTPKETKPLTKTLTTTSLNASPAISLGKAGAKGETSIISSTLNYLDFTSNKYILNILKNKNALLKLEQAKIKKELERVKIKKELNLTNLKKELILALFLKKIEIDSLLFEDSLLEDLTKFKEAVLVKEEEDVKEEDEKERNMTEADRSLIQLQLKNLIIKLDKNIYKNKLEISNLKKDLKLANLKKDLELDKPFSKTFQGFYLQLLLKKSFSFIKKNSKKRILLKLKLIKDQLNIANNLDLNNLNSKIDNFKFDFNKKIILNKIEQPLLLSLLAKGKGLEKKNNTLIHNYLNSFTKSNNIININPNLTKKYGIILKFNKIIGFNFLNKIKVNNTNWLYEYKEETYKLLFYFFKSIYCLISKPNFIFEQDKITIRLFFYLFKKDDDLNSKNNLGINLKKGLNNKKESMRDLVTFEESIKNINFKKFKRNVKPLAFTRSKGAFSFGTYGSFSSFGKPRRIRLTKSNLLIKENLIEKNKDLLNNNKYNLGSVFYDKFLIITNILSILFNKPVKLEITRVHNLTADSNILANAIQLVMKNKNLKPLRVISDIYNINNIYGVNVPLLKYNTKLIAFLSGLNVNINGRLLKDAIVPKNTVKKFEKGAFAPGKVNFIDTSFITKKNRKGAYNIKVKSAQNFMF